MTQNPSTTVDRGEFSVMRTIAIAASIDKVWAAITEAGHLERWFPMSAVLPEVAVGTRGVFTFDGYGDFAVRVEEVDAPRAIAYRWGRENNNAPHELGPDNSTVFRFTLEAVDGGTRLTVVETGFAALPDPAASMDDNRNGWDSELDRLVVYLENRS